MKNVAFFALVIFLTCFISLQCNRQVNPAFILSPPLKNVNIPVSEYMVEPDKPSVIQTVTGGSIEIPANAFVDKNNKPVKDKVKINYREFRDGFDIMLAGYSLAYDSGGVSYNFSTAGMFEINGSSKNEPVFIANGKSLTVNLESENNENYNFYVFDTIENNWKYISKNAVIIQDTSIATDSVQPDITFGLPPPTRLNSKSQIIDLNVDYSRFSELKAFKGILWEYSSMNSNPDVNSVQWIFETKWRDINLESFKPEMGLYKMQLANKNQSTELLVTPVLNENDYKKAITVFNKKKKEFEIGRKKRIQEDFRTEREQSFIRTANINQFGIYNCDRIYMMQNTITIKSNFILDKKVDVDLNSINIYHLITNQNSLISVGTFSLSSFRFNPKDDNMLIAILPDDRIAVFSRNKFRDIINNNSGSSEIPNYTFNMKVIDDPVTTVEEFKSLMNNI